MTNFVNLLKENSNKTNNSIPLGKTP